MFLASSCGTGIYLTSGYTDDVYYTPAQRTEVIETSVMPEAPTRILEREIELIEPDTIIEEVPEYNLLESETETYVDEDGTTVINNYYYDSEYGDYGDYYYTNRINRFYRPSIGFGFYDPMWSYNSWGYYDPFYSDWYYPYSSFGWYSSWYSPYYYSSWYSPWYSPWYSSRWYNPYWYGNDYWYGGGGGYYDRGDNYYYGHRNSGITDGMYANRSGGMKSAGSLYGTRGSVATGNGSALKTDETNARIVARSSSDSKSVSTASGLRSGSGNTQEVKTRSSITSQEARTNSGSYVRSRTSTSLINPTTKGSSSLRSSGTTTRSASRSIYVRPKSSGTSGTSSTYNRSTSVSGSQSGATRSSGVVRSGST